MEQDCQSAADLAVFLGHFREEEKRPGHHCRLMCIVPIKTGEFVHVRILSVYVFPRTLKHGCFKTKQNTSIL